MDETKSGVNAKLEIWQKALESKGFHLSRTKMMYMEYKFSKSRNKDKGAIRLDGQEILKSESFRYIGSIIHKDGENEEDVNHSIRAGGWSGVWPNVHIKLKGKFYKIVIRLAMLYGRECRTKKQHIHKMSLAKMRLLRWISGNRQKDMIWIEEIRLKIRPHW